MQKMWGRQQEFFENMELMFGKDTYYWFLPTHPCIKINYLERLYSKNQLKQIVRSGMEFEEEEWDLNKKAYLIELRRSNMEKKIAIASIIIFAISWFTILQGKMTEFGEY